MTNPPHPPTGSDEEFTTDALFALTYDELRRLAASKIASESPGHTLQPTSLVNEAYLRLVKANPGRPWNNRRHFFGAAAEAMRRILVEHARRKGRRGVTSLDLDTLAGSTPNDDDVIALSEAIDALAVAWPRAAELVKLRYFTGLTQAEAAAVLELSPRTADNDWAWARTWLKEFLSRGDA